jgi:hypothetical protein
MIPEALRLLAGGKVMRLFQGLLDRSAYRRHLSGDMR